MEQCGVKNFSMLNCVPDSDRDLCMETSQLLPAPEKKMEKKQVYCSSKSQLHKPAPGLEPFRQSHSTVGH